MSALRTALLVFLLMAIAVAALPAFASSPVYTAELSGIVDPSTADYLARALKQAQSADAGAFVLVMNTPGGLVESARTIMSTFQEARIPVIVFVSPSGSQATSAGSLIALSANLIAMAPGTTIGAAHPVTETGQAAGEKVTNVVASYARTAAARRGRDVDLAQSLVTKSISLTADEALGRHLADVKATNLRDLLQKIDGRTVDGRVLHTARAPVVPVERIWREDFLHALAYPTLAYLLLMLGFYGLIFELSNPGAILPGVVGGISLILACYSLSILPINAAGIALILLALLLFIADVKVPSHGVLTAGGIIAFFLGSMMLFDSSSPILRVSLGLVIGATLATAGFFAFAVRAGVRARHLKVTTGTEGMLGKVGEARTDLDPKGRVFFEGALWTAISPEPVRTGDPVRITRVEGLTLYVEPANSNL